MNNGKTWKGFELRELRLCGPDQLPGRLVFKPGLNVIEGASDTGKSFALSCVDFLLGAKALPEEIPQARPYDIAYLCIEATDGQFYTLKRALSGGKIGLFRGALDDALTEDTEWEARGVKNNTKDSISDFLLGLCGLKGKLVRKNNRGKTQKASFRMLAKALLVEEERIIAKQSPLYGSQKMGNTAEANTIRMVLTGIDDSGIVQSEDPKTTAGKLAGRKELIEGWIVRHEAALEKLLKNMDTTPGVLSELDASLREMSQLSSTALEVLRAAESERVNFLHQKREQQERLLELDGMLARSSLLDAHYQTDLLRLESMQEAAYLLQMYGEKPCEYCGAEPEHHRPEEAQVPETTLQAAVAEAAKVQRLRVELQKASDQMSIEQHQVRKSMHEVETAIENLDAEIDTELTPQVRTTADELLEIQSVYGDYVRSEQLRAQIDSLNSQLHELETSPNKNEKLEFSELTANTMSGVCSRIKTLFQAWGMDVQTVAFDEKSADLLVNGRKRTGHGKGVRAIMCAGFVIGLMQEALKARRGHPGFVVLDTPLNPYKEADADDEGTVATSVKDAFYQDLSSAHELGQVIVFENVAPPADVKEACNHIHFSKSSTGRYGFLPVPKKP